MWEKYDLTDNFGFVTAGNELSWKRSDSELNVVKSCYGPILKYCSIRGGKFAALFWIKLKWINIRPARWENNTLCFLQNTSLISELSFYCFVGDNPWCPFLAETTQVHRRRSHPFKNLSRINRTSFSLCFWEDYRVFSQIWANGTRKQKRLVPFGQTDRLTDVTADIQIYALNIQYW